MRRLILLMLIVLAVSPFFLVQALASMNAGGVTVNAGYPVKQNNIRIIVLVRLRDYFRDEPFVNYTVSVKCRLRSTGKIVTKVVEGVTNETGEVSAELELTGTRLIDAAVRTVTITAGNMTPLVIIQVSDMLVEQLGGVTKFYPDSNTTYLDMINIPMYYSVIEGNTTLVYCDIRVLKGVFVNVSDFSPVLRRKISIYVKPGSVVEGASYTYETTFLAPLNYTVTVGTGHRGPEALVKIKEYITNETRLISWTYYFVDKFIRAEYESLKDDVEWFHSFGYPIMYEEEIEAYQLLLDQSLDMYKVGNYSEAIGATEALINAGLSLWRSLDTLRAQAFATSILLMLMILGFSVAIINLFIPYSSRKETFKFIVFISVTVFLVATQPAFRIAAAMMLAAFSVNVAAFDFLTLVVSTLMVASITYVIYGLLQVFLKPERRLSPSIAIQYLRARGWLTFLLVVTISLTISSAIMVLKIGSVTLLQETPVEAYVDKAGIYADINIIPRPHGFSEYEISWLKTQFPGYNFTAIVEPSPMVEGLSTGVIIGEDIIPAYIMAIDPVAFRSLFNVDAAVSEGRFLYSRDEYGIVLSTVFKKYVELGGEVSTCTYNLTEEGEYQKVTDVTPTLRIVGFVEPQVLEDMLGPDGRQLIPDPKYIVFVPIDQIIDWKNMVYKRIIFFKPSGSGDEESLRSMAKKLSLIFPARVTAMSKTGAMVYEKVTTIMLKGFEGTFMMLIIASMLVFTSLIGLIEERKRDLRTLAVLGAPPSTLSSLILMESLILGFISSLIGWMTSPLVAVAAYWFTRLAGGASLEVHGLYVPTMDSAFVAVLVGLLTTLVSGAVPASRVQKLSLMGRAKKKVISSEDLRIEGDTAKYLLPLRVSMFETNLLYRFLRSEIIDKKDFMGEEVYLDGTFSITFGIPVSSGDVIRSSLKTVKREDVLLLELHIPERYKEYMWLSETVRNLEQKILKYPEWKSRQLRYVILRREPTRGVITLEDLIGESEKVLAEIDDLNQKLEKLENVKRRIPARLYEEYKNRYQKALSDSFSRLRLLGVRLEPFYKQLKEEVEKLSYEMQSLNLALEMGEMSREEYEEKAAPVKERLTDYRDKLMKIERVYTLLSKRSQELTEI